MSAPKYSVFQVKPARDSIIGQASFVQFLSALRSSLSSGFFDRLLGTHDTISLEIANLNQTTFFIITCPEKIAHLVKSQIASHYPNALINPMEDYLPHWLNHGKPLFATLNLTSPSYLPIQTTEEEGVDQLTGLVGSLARLSPDSAAVIQICLFAAPKGWQNASRKMLDLGVGKDPLKFEPHPKKTLIEGKLTHQAFAVDVRLAAITPHETTSKQLLQQLSAAFGTYSSSEGNSFKLNIPSSSGQSKLKKSLLERSVRYASQNQYLNYLEISSLFHLPGENMANLRNIAWGKTLKGEPPFNLPVDDGLTEDERNEINFFAKTEFRNHHASFGIRKGDDRRRHVYILGKSGTGKSTLIANMAINDIRHGEGVALVDPHGDTAEHLLDYIPSNRLNDVAYLDPSAKGKSFHLNPLYIKNPAYSELVASGIVSIFSKLYGNSWGPRLEYILRNTLLTLVHRPGSTLLDVPRLLTNKKFREEVLLKVNDSVLHDFWHDEYDKYSEKFQSEAIAPILNKVGQFITSPTIRDIISHSESTVDFEDLMNDGKIIILNLPQGKIGEDNAALLGAMFISQIQIAAMNRANIAESERKDFFLYVDEFQNFATTSFIKILSEARKYRLNLILANQYTAQLPEEIQKAIFGNAGTIISFVVGADDANRLIGELGDYYTQDDLVNLAKYQIILKLTVGSSVSAPFPALTLALPQTINQNRDKVIALSQERFYRPTIIPEPISSTSQKPVSSVDTTISSSPTSQSATISTPTIKPYQKPSLPDINSLDRLRQKGFRPSVIGCFLNQNKILFFYQPSHKIWMLPQGGVNNQESLFDAYKRVMIDQTTEDFFVTTSTPELIGFDQIEFPPSKQNLTDLNLDSGQKINMKGKSYYFLASQTPKNQLTVLANEFEKYLWLDYDESIKLIKENSTRGKLRITLNLLNTLKNQGLLTAQKINKQ